MHRIWQILPKYHPDTVQQELEALFNELTLKHPGFYRYQDTLESEMNIKEMIASITDSVNEMDIYQLLKPAIADIGCLHTGIELSEATEEFLNSEPNCFPWTLYFYQGEAFIVGTYDLNDKDKLPLGAKVLSINQRSIEEILSMLLDQVPMDGNNQSGKIAILNRQFPIWYRNIIDLTNQFSITYTLNGQTSSTTLYGVPANKIPSYEDVANVPLSSTWEEDFAILTVPSFANSYHKRLNINFKKEVKTFFKEINTRDIRKLIIDLRGNTGGSDGNAVFLASHFFEEDFNYWDRIEVSEAIAKDIKGINRLFYAKPILQNGKYLWRKSPMFTSEFDYYETQKPSKNIFKGKLIILIDGLCMSSCADFAAIMSHHQKAVFVGEETGGGYQGNTSGIIPEAELSSGIKVYIPLLKYVNAVDEDQNFGRGTTPDITMDIPPEDLMEGKDTIKLKAIQLIEE